MGNARRRWEEGRDAEGEGVKTDVADAVEETGKGREGELFFLGKQARGWS